MKAELIFIPSPGAGHLVSTVEVAKLLVGRDDRIYVSIMIMKLPFDTGTDAFTQNLKNHASERLAFVNVPALDETSMTELMSVSRMYFLDAFVEKQQTQVRDLVTSILNRSKSSKLCGFVIDMFCTSMIDVANEFKVPAYAFFTSSASFLSLMFYTQKLKDHESRDIHEYRDSNVELAVPGFCNPVPVKVLPSPMLTKDGCSLVIATARRLQETKAILVNTIWELEANAIESLAADDEKSPDIYHVGPILLTKSGDTATYNKTSEEATITWLDSQPLSSVVFLCFGSMGSFDIEQVREISHALEHSGQRFLWSLRLPSEEKNKVVMPKDVEDYNEVLPEGFLRRTSGIGKVIGWAPQVTILSHPAVGGFVSHCGWNSILESIWCGVPIATWPIYAEQQINAFELVVELGLAVEIKMDYRKDSFANMQSPAVTAEEIERGIRCLMDGASGVRKKMQELKDVCRQATVVGGSSYNSLGKFIGDLMDNVLEGASD